MAKKWRQNQKSHFRANYPIFSEFRGKFPSQMMRRTFLDSCVFFVGAIFKPREAICTFWLIQNSLNRVYDRPIEVTPCRKVFFKTPNFVNMGLRENLIERFWWRKGRATKMDSCVFCVGTIVKEINN